MDDLQLEVSQDPVDRVLGWVVEPNAASVVLQFSVGAWLFQLYLSEAALDEAVEAGVVVSLGGLFVDELEVVFGLLEVCNFDVNRGLFFAFDADTWP